MHRGRTQINEETVRLEHAPGFVKGMNHALMGHSSQHPSEDYKVEGLVREIDLFRFSDVIANPFGEPAGQMPAGRTNELRSGVQGVYVGAKPRETQCKPPITAADFEDAFAAPISNALEC